MHRIEEAEIEGFAALRLASPDGVEACYVPGAGMVCASLREAGAELLGQRQGLAAYASRGSTMGIPLLHPWANRLARWGYALDGQEIALPRDPERIADDGSLPIHGIVPAHFEWRIVERDAGAGSARLAAEVDVGALPGVLELFPFPHLLRMEIELCGPALRVETRLRATGERAVPVAFGYHPYFRIPEIPRAEWQVELPVRRRARLDERFLPTGESDPVEEPRGPLAERVYDTLYPEIDPQPVFALSGAGRRLELAFGPGFPVAVVYAPANDDVVCFEPMTAPTNPFEGGGPLLRVAPGDSASASFELRVLRDA